MSILLFLVAGAATLAAGLMVLRLPPTLPAAAFRPAPVSQVAPQPVTPESIRTVLEDAGFRNVRNIRSRGVFYSVQADTLAGFEARIVVNGPTGKIVGVRLSEPARDPVASTAPD